MDFEVAPFINWLDIMVTNKCNIRCSYCFHSKNETDLSLEVVKKISSFLGEQFTNKIVFNLFGGEPLLRVDFCMECMKYLRSKYPNCTFFTSTNCTIFSEEFVDFFLQDNDFNVIQLSYDGLNQNKNRCDDKLVIDNIKRYIKVVPSKNLSVRMTMPPQDVYNLSDNIIYLYNLGARDISHHADISNAWTSEQIDTYRLQLDSIYVFLDSHKDLKMRYCGDTYSYYEKKSPKCSMGDTLLAVDCDGSIYPCHRMVSYPDFKIGDVNDETLNRGMFRNMELPKCMECDVRSTCHPCVAANFDVNGRFREPVVSLCEMSKYEHIKRNPQIIKVDEEMEKLFLSSMKTLEQVQASNYETLKLLA